MAFCFADCTRAKFFKHLITADYSEEEIRLHLHDVLGTDRTIAGIIATMEKFEVALSAHMREKQDDYTEQLGGAKAYEAWCKKSLGHEKNHPAHAWIVTYSREFCFNIRHLPIFDYISEKNVIFDILHGLLNCVKDQFVAVLNDLVASNPPELFVKKLHLIFKEYEYLGELHVHGKEEPFSKPALDGNGCVELLNAWEAIIEALLGVSAQDLADTAKLQEEKQVAAGAVKEANTAAADVLHANIAKARVAARKEARPVVKVWY